MSFIISYHPFSHTNEVCVLCRLLLTWPYLPNPYVNYIDMMVMLQLLLKDQLKQVLQ